MSDREYTEVKMTKKQRRHLQMVLESLIEFPGCRVSDIMTESDFTAIEQICKRMKKVDG